MILGLLWMNDEMAHQVDEQHQGSCYVKHANNESHSCVLLGISPPRQPFVSGDVVQKETDILEDQRDKWDKSFLVSLLTETEHKRNNTNNTNCTSCLHMYSEWHIAYSI